MIVDPYLLLHLSTFLSVRDFTNLTRTCHLYADDPLVVDEVSKRLFSATTMHFASFANNVNMQFTRKYDFDSNTALVFSMSPVPLFELHDGMPLHDMPSIYRQLRFHIQIPGWDFAWSGYIVCDNDIADMRDRDFVYEAVSSVFGTIEMVLYHDGDHVFVREIRFKYTRNLKRYVKWLYWRQVIYSTVAFITTMYIAFINNFAERVGMMILALLSAVYLTGGTDKTTHLRPIKNYI